MNAYAKYVLIPQQEYARLKKESQTRILLDSNKPKILKKNEISQNLVFKDPPKIFGKTSEQDNKVLIKEIEESNLPESIKSKLSDGLNDLDDDDEDEDDFQPAHSSTPRGSFSGMLDLEATATGQLVDRRGKPVRQSNIKTVKNFLLSPKAKKKPAGTQAALDKLREQRPDLLNRIRNKNIRKQLKLDQSGSGWISIRKF